MRDRMLGHRPGAAIVAVALVAIAFVRRLYEAVRNADRVGGARAHGDCDAR